MQDHRATRPGQIGRTALRILDGADPRQLKRFSALMDDSPTDLRLDATSRQAEARRAAKQNAWLRSHGRP